jgi:hypothetical protein
MMTDQSCTTCPNVFQFDVLCVVLEFVTRPDLGNLISTNKKLQAMLDDELVYEHFARHKYPSNTLVVSRYRSWKELLKDDNAKNGAYMLQGERAAVPIEQRSWKLPAPPSQQLPPVAIAKWRMNNSSAAYFNSVKNIMWDRHLNHIVITVEAFGARDLRTAVTTSFFRVHGLPIPPRAILLRPLFILECSKHNSPTYQLCQFYFQASDFRPGCAYKYTYNGSPTIRGSDYECVTFLGRLAFPTSLKELFTLDKENCSFISVPSTCSRRVPQSPSNILDWNVTLPRQVSELHKMGGWGTPRTVPPRTSVSSSNNSNNINSISSSATTTHHSRINELAPEEQEELDDWRVVV